MYNRVHAILVHCPGFSFEGPGRLAKEVGCSRSSISRLIRVKSRTSSALVEKVTAALSKALGRPLEAPEVFSLDGRFPTRSGCALCGCKGCLPEEAYDARSNLRPAFKNMRPGDWSLAPTRPRGEP
jgi:hypothetical protein